MNTSTECIIRRFGGEGVGMQCLLEVDWKVIFNKFMQPIKIDFDYFCKKSSPKISIITFFTNMTSFKLNVNYSFK